MIFEREQEERGELICQRIEDVDAAADSVSTVIVFGSYFLF